MPVPRSLPRPITTPQFHDEVATDRGDPPDGYHDGPIHAVRDDSAARDDDAPRDIADRRRFPRGSQAGFAPPTERVRVARPTARSGGETLARLFYFTSGVALAAAVAVYGSRMWREAHERPAAATVAPPPAPAMAVAAAGGRVELAADHRSVTRIAGTGPHWTAAPPVALDAVEITGPLLLGHTPDALVALDLESGRTRFTWSPPGDERWAAQRPVALGSCLVALTTRARKTVLRCLDPAAGTVRWTAALAGARDCTQPPAALPGAYLLPCPGWTAIVDERTGAVSVDAGGVGLVQDRPPFLLRAGSRLTLAPWSATRRRFTQTGEQSFGATATAVGSAVLYKDRLVIRATESSDELAVIASHDAPPTPIAAAVYRLADAAPLVRTCGGATSPRFQLLQLAPRIGASFDPATAADRALALLDVERATLAWTSRKVAGLALAAGPPICRGGHYVVPIQLPGAGSALWVIDAETGKTIAAVAADPELDASFARLTADQVDDDRVVGIGRAGAFELRWQPPGPGSGPDLGHGFHDARHDLEAALGPLP